MEGEGDQLRSFFPLVVRRSAPLQEKELPLCKSVIRSEKRTEALVLGDE